MDTMKVSCLVDTLVSSPYDAQIRVVSPFGGRFLTHKNPFNEEPKLLIFDRGR
jgi:hypothetical protein